MKMLLNTTNPANVDDSFIQNREAFNAFFVDGLITGHLRRRNVVGC